MNITVYGSGCKACHKMYEALLEAVAEVNPDITTAYVDDFTVIMSKGFMSMPDLEINGKVATKGKVLKKKDIIALIKG